MTRAAPPLAALLAAAVAAPPADVRGCGAAFRPGERVDVADEAALIVWDEATKTEHFVRRATFVGGAYDFGFLVPTPARPQLEPADPVLFDNLRDLTAPKVVTRYETGLNLGCGFGGGARPRGRAGSEPPRAAGGVEVLEQKRVGDLDAAVLGFGKGQNPDDAAADLVAWLNRNRYTARPELVEWVRPYAANGWVVTAFKLAGPPPAAGPGAAQGATGRDAGAAAAAGPKAEAAVRMSFKVEDGRPFFPYREPADQRDERARGVPRLLRVYVVSGRRVAGTLGDGSAAWPGKTVWAGPVPDRDRDALARSGELPAGAAPAGERWLTEFEDASAPRPGTDEVYFGPSADPSPVARPPVTRVVTDTPWWLGALLLAGAAAVAAAAVVVLRRLTK
jgi:hypothetical protein